MSTDISPEISKKSRWWISRERYYELKHFSMQYPEWKKVLSNKLYLSSGSVVVLTGGQIEFKDPVSGVASEAEYYEKNVEIVEACAEASDIDIHKWLLEAVTTGVSYEYLLAAKDIPCGRSKFYEAYRKYFWLLDKCRR